MAGTSIACLRLAGLLNTLASMNVRLSFLMAFMWMCCSCDGAEPVTRAQAREALDKGTHWLLAHQAPEGCFHAPMAGKPPAQPPLVPQYSGAYTALAVLALHEAGHRPKDATPEGQAMIRAVNFLCKSIEALPPSNLKGVYLGRTDRSRMYGHGIMTCMLATVVHELPDPSSRAAVLDRIIRAVELIIASQQNRKKEQSDSGGWRYEPQALDSDLSITVWQLRALRAAADASLTVPEAALRVAGEFVKRCGRQGQPATASGGQQFFSYEPANDKPFSAATTAAGAVAMQCAGLADDPQTQGALQTLAKHEYQVDERWLTYGLSHGSRAMQQAGADMGSAFGAKVRALLVPRQNSDGAWPAIPQASSPSDSVFTTSVAIMALAPWAEKRAGTKE